jgi:hypothetical protein
MRFVQHRQSGKPNPEREENAVKPVTLSRTVAMPAGEH